MSGECKRSNIMENISILSVLFVERNPHIIGRYKKLLEESPYLPPLSMTIARSLDEALFHTKNRVFDLIFLNLFLDDSQNLDTYLIMNKYASQSTIIILSPEGQENIAFDAISLGAEDYLLENEIDMYTVSRTIRNALERHGLKEALKALTFTDELTSLYNRRGFLTLSKQQLELAKREKKELCLFLIDLDHLKDTNDNYGHKMGDLALIATAYCLKKTFRTSDIIARIGGDEFAVLAIGTSVKETEYIAHHLQEIIELYNLEFRDLPTPLSLSWGKAHYHPHDQILIEDLIEKADQELYIAKKISHQKQK